MHREPDEPLDGELLLQVRRRIGRRVRELRGGRSQRDLATRAGITQPQWGRIENGASDPTLSSLLRIQDALELESIEALFGVLPSRQIRR